MKGILIAIITSCLFGCALLNKTSKTTTTDKQSLEKQLESSQLLLKTANKETQIITYWNDTGFYQIQNTREQIDLSKRDRLKTAEKALTKQETILKKTEPLNSWTYALIAIVVIGCFLIFRKLGILSR